MFPNNKGEHLSERIKNKTGGDSYATSYDRKLAYYLNHIHSRELHDDWPAPSLDAADYSVGWLGNFDASRRLELFALEPPRSAGHNGVVGSH